ncbi:uncharacterized protein [Eurosta solidaginis]|uniref:uncharacterized protein n=1 Tax=Eurosta solidaginis TaxID=178769 RepID=UPI00353063EE
MDTNSSLSQCDTSVNYSYISHVDFIRMLRESYKEGIQNTFNDMKSQVEKDCEKKTQEAEKVLILLNHCHRTIYELDEQHKSIGKTLRKHAEQAKMLTEQIRQEKHQRMQTLKEDELAMWQLLNELRPQNT